ncbi:hypothetical protein POM88_037602 [Heracleum sosnowskyi]|uniref:Uncharacterized protein n=1 Tax=Heracleum sosnowskyi TaxID=360622 RepID=A0AAD8HQI4_9APIA|nr:hypothetical protein POM88_037602 [Heracleum sosnowskyi]
MTVIIGSEEDIFVLRKGADTIISNKLSEIGRIFHESTRKHYQYYRECSEAFILHLAVHCASVTCSRILKQNALVKRDKETMSAIKDGSNDVGMIRESDHIGVGITDVKECKNAGVMSSDFAIANAGYWRNFP